MALLEPTSTSRSSRPSSIGSGIAPLPGGPEEPDAAQQVVRIVRDEMLALFGNTAGGLPPSQAHPGSSCCSVSRAGKTTTAGSLDGG